MYRLPKTFGRHAGHIKRMHDMAYLGGPSDESLAETLRQRVLEPRREGH